MGIQSDLGPFEYGAEAPTSIVFKPLNKDKEFNGAELMDLYSVRKFPNQANQPVTLNVPFPVPDNFRSNSATKFSVSA